MSPELALKLTTILEAYFNADTVRDLAGLCEVELDRLYDQDPRWLAVAREMVEQLDQGNTRRLVDSLLELAERRNDDAVTHTTWERQVYHQGLSPVIQEARKLLESSAAPSELTVAAGSPFSAKSRVRELLESATTELFLVDPYVGVGTLDCLRGLTVSIRLLTGQHSDSIDPGFDRALADFGAEGHSIEVRRAARLHDRHLLFNDRCWLVGGSLKDAGKKAFNCIEITDKGVIVADLEAKWQAAAAYP